MDVIIETPDVVDRDTVEEVEVAPTLTDVYNYLMSIDRRLSVMEDVAAELQKFIENFQLPPMLQKMFGKKDA